MFHQEIRIYRLEVGELSDLLDVDNYFSWHQNFVDGYGLGDLKEEKQWQQVLHLALHKQLHADLNYDQN